MNDIKKTIGPSRFSSTEFLVFMTGIILSTLGFFLGYMDALTWAGFFTALAVNLGFVRVRGKRVAVDAMKTEIQAGGAGKVDSNGLDS